MDRPLNRSERKRIQTRENIMRAGRVVFQQKGYHATSVTDIMSYADLGYGTFYQYFQNKKDLFLNMLQDIETLIESKLRLKIPMEERNIEQRIYIGVKSVLQIYFEYRDLLLIIRESMSLDEDFRKVGDRIQQIISEKAARDYQWCNKHGLCRDIDVEVATMCIVNMLQGAGDKIIYQSLSERDVDWMARNISKLIYYGLFTAEFIPLSETK